MTEVLSQGFGGVETQPNKRFSLQMAENFLLWVVGQLGKIRPAEGRVVERDPTNLLALAQLAAVCASTQKEAASKTSIDSFARDRNKVFLPVFLPYINACLGDGTDTILYLGTCVVSGAHNAIGGVFKHKLNQEAVQKLSAHNMMAVDAFTFIVPVLSSDLPERLQELLPTKNQA